MEPKRRSGIILLITLLIRLTLETNPSTRSHSQTCRERVLPLLLVFHSQTSFSVLCPSSVSTSVLFYCDFYKQISR